MFILRFADFLIFFPRLVKSVKMKDIDSLASTWLGHSEFDDSPAACLLTCYKCILDLAYGSLPFIRAHVLGNSYITESQTQIQYFLEPNLEPYVETNRVQSTAIPLENSKRHSTAARS